MRVVEEPDGAARERLAARGCSRDGGDPGESLAWPDRDGCARYVVTDVSPGGMVPGPNVELYRAVRCQRPAVPPSTDPSFREQAGILDNKPTSWYVAGIPNQLRDLECVFSVVTTEVRR